MSERVNVTTVAYSVEAVKVEIKIKSIHRDATRNRSMQGSAVVFK